MADHDHKVVWASMCLGTYGLLRMGEFARLASSSPYPTGSDFKRVDKEHYTFHLPESKTDPFRLGVDIHVFANGSRTCPVNAMRAIGADGRDPDAPLFQLSDGSPLSSAFLNKWIRYLFRESNTPFTGFSFRRGGATSLAVAGVPDHMIRALGRWRSWVYQVYVDTPPERLRQCFQSASAS